MAIPTDIAGLQAWYKADANTYSDTGTTLCLVGDTIRQCNDQSGNSRTLTQATLANRPTYKIAIGSYNDLPVMRFIAPLASGVAQWLDTATFGVAISQPTTFFWCAMNFALPQGGFGATFFDSNTGVNENTVLILDINGTGIGEVYSIYAGTSLNSGSPVPDLNVMNFYIAIFNGASSSLIKNLTTILSGAVGAQTLPQLRIGSNVDGQSGLYGDMPEIGFYNVALSVANINALFDYMTGRYVPETLGMALFTFVDGTNVLREVVGTTGTSFGTENRLFYVPTGGSVRDPSVVVINGTRWLAHTNVASASVKCTSFSVASSLFGRMYTPVVDVDCTAVSGNTNASRTWAPEWVKDSAAPQGWRIFFCASTTGDVDTGFQIYETHPTNAGFTTWSTPVAVAGTGFPNNMIDPFVVQAAGNYFLWYKNENTKFVEVFKSSSLMTGYTSMYTGDWMGIGSGVEGPCVIFFNGQWRLYIDRYLAGTGVAYTNQTSGDWTVIAGTWAAMTGISGLAFQANHGTVINTSTPPPAHIAMNGGGLVF